jgi:hypothetical protein
MEKPMLPECPRESAALPLAERMKAPSCAQYLTDLAAMGAGQPAELRPTDIGSTISNGGRPPPAALAHHEPTRELARPPTPHCPAQLDDGALVLAGELAWKRLRAAPTMSDWVAVGKALLVLRKQAVAEAGAYNGIRYSKRNAALLDKHGFREISKSARQCAMLMVENWPAIEHWLAGFEVDRKLNHPLVIWRGWLASQRPKQTQRHHTGSTWRNRGRTEPSMFAKVIAAIRPLLPDQDESVIKDVSCAAVRAMGFSVPAAIYRAREQMETAHCVS